MSEHKVPLRTKILYGVGDVAVNIKTTSLNQFLLFYYADVLLVAPTLIGAALFVGKVWDAITDPIMGYVSDTTRSVWGRRRPYVAAAAVPIGVCYYFLFAPPVTSAWALTVYLALAFIFLDTFFTMFATPYMAWGAELARDYHDRTVVVQVRGLFGVLGGVLGATLPVLIAQQFADQRVGYSRMALMLGLLMAVSALITGLGVKDQPQPQAPKASMRHFIGGLRGTFSNQQFTIVFATFCLMTSASAIGQSIQLIVVKYRLDMYDFFPVIALVFALSFAASFPLWLAISRRIGKHRGLMLGLALSCVTPFGWLIVQPGQQALMLLFMVAGGITTGSLTLAVSQAADVIDVDELVSGEKRAGAYFGIWTLGLKGANAAGTLLGGLLLSVVGYVPQAVQHPDTLWWLVMLVGPVQAVVHLIGLLIFRRMQLTGDQVAEIQAVLNARREEALGPARSAVG